MSAEQQIEFQKGQLLQVKPTGVYPFLMRDKFTEPTRSVSAHRIFFLEEAVKTGLSLEEAELIASECCQEYWDHIGFKIEDSMAGQFTGLTTLPVREQEKQCLLVEFNHQGHKVYAMVGDNSVMPA